MQVVRPPEVVALKKLHRIAADLKMRARVLRVGRGANLQTRGVRTRHSRSLHALPVNLAARLDTKDMASRDGRGMRARHHHGKPVDHLLRFRIAARRLRLISSCSCPA